MLFHSYEFVLLFLPLTLIGFHLLAGVGGRAQIAFLIGASIVFYAVWRLQDVWVLLSLMFVTYVVARGLERYPSRTLLALGIAINLGTLAYFKYIGFFGEVAGSIAGSGPIFAAVVLPLGISFFVFQKIAYLVDTYRGRTLPHGFLDYALFVSFFPQLIAGPIVHQSEMLRQFRNRPGLGLQPENLAVGLTLFTFGLFKKIVLADHFAAYADPGFEAAAQGPIDATLAWTATLAYTFQLYFDFSAYTDMAIGLGKMFGIRLPINFNSPYKARSITEFWNRWHITLSRFLRDYLYIPLGGNRFGHTRRYANLLITMLLGGLWHGASWTFVAWGALHGTYLCINHAWRRYGFPLPGFVAWLVTFLVVTVAWVLFRAPDFATAGRVLSAMANPLTATVSNVAALAWIVAGLIITMQFPNTQQMGALVRPALGALELPRGVHTLLLWRPTVAWGLVSGCLLVWALASSWSTSEPPPFLYFNF
jgi:D-alanyl-lipoteichoic acid acyltransferase DltB (MBOAT superfamily)